MSQGQDVTYVTERCVMKLTPNGLVITEIAPGADLERDILGQAAIPLAVAKDLKTMDATVSSTEDLFGLQWRKQHEGDWPSRKACAGRSTLSR